MELQLFETNLQLETSQPLNARVLKILVNLNPILAEDEPLLLSYYKRVRATWSSSAIKTLQKSTGLKLTNKLNRCQFAIAAARFELQFIEPEVDAGNCYLIPESVSSELPNITLSQEEDKGRQFGSELNATSLSFQSVEVSQNPLSEQLQIAQQQILELESQLKEQQEQLEQQIELLEQSKNFSSLLLTNRLLLPGLPLNGTQESPAMRILGSPTTLTELEAHYRELIKREHPDVSPFPQEEAINRFAYLRSLYRITRSHWQVLKPTAMIKKGELETRMKAPVPFDPESFWAA